MKVHKAVLSVGLAGTLIGGVIAVAAPAGAITNPRGNTIILNCDNVVALSKIADSTKKGISPTPANLKVAGIQATEKDVPGTATYSKYETDPNSGTPDVGDTDSCTGPLTNTSTSVWNGQYNPYTPAQNFSGSFNEIVKIAGALTGRASLNLDPDNDGLTGTCDPNETGVDASQYLLHGKLTVAFGSQASVGSPNTPTKLDALGKNVQGQFYVAAKQENVDINGDGCVGDPIPGAGTPTVADTSDIIAFRGIGIKGVGEGAWYDQKTSFRPPFNNLVYALETLGNADVTGDGIIGEPPAGGLVTLVTDTDVDTDSAGNAFGGATAAAYLAAYNNRTLLSIDVCAPAPGPNC